MNFSLTWLPEVLKDAGLKVAEVDGWKTRGFGNVWPILGVVCHHTGTPNPKKLNFPTKTGLTKGVTQTRADGTTFFLEGPLCQLALGRDGTFYIVAAGRANHAGKGKWIGEDNNGNASYIGIEAENDGTASDFPWPEVQMDAYRRGVAAILRHLKLTANACCGHREYAPKRKDDPTFDMNIFRLGVAAILDGSTPPPAPIPAVDAKKRPTLRRGMTNPLVREVQRKVGIAAADFSDHFGPKTEAAVRQFQRTSNMVPDGIVGPKTWLELDRKP
jgi:N-acetylmuramoyl-L-alanine amidase/Putative peptidoglycan binding domain